MERMESLPGFLLRQPAALWPGEVVRAAKRICQVLKAVHAKGFVHTDVRVPNLLVKEDGNAVLGDWEQMLRIDDRVTIKTLGDTSCLAPSILAEYTKAKQRSRRRGDLRRVSLCFRPVHDLLSLAYSVACLLGGAHFAPPWPFAAVEDVLRSRRAWLDLHATDATDARPPTLFNPLGRSLREYITRLEDIDAADPKPDSLQLPPDLYDFDVDIPAPPDVRTNRWITAADEAAQIESDELAQRDEDGDGFTGVAEVDGDADDYDDDYDDDDDDY
jgi:serine/threonine protein kinase